jgi:hypothetical protein
VSIRIHTGGLLKLDPDADEAFEVDWNAQHLPQGVGLTSSTWVVAGVRGAASLDDHDPGIGEYNADDEWESAAAGRVTRVFLTGISGITEGQKYRITNRIVTDTTPPETKDASFTVLIERE